MVDRGSDSVASARRADASPPGADEFPSPRQRGRYLAFSGRVEVRRARYLGGHPERPHPEKVRYLYLTTDGVEFRTGLTPTKVGWDAVRGLEVMEAGALEARLAEGGTALGDRAVAPNGTGPAYLVIVTDHGGPVFEVAGVSVGDLEDLVAPARTNVGGGTAAAAEAPAEGGGPATTATPAAEPAAEPAVGEAEADGSLAIPMGPAGDGDVAPLAETVGSEADTATADAAGPDDDAAGPDDDAAQPVDAAAQPVDAESGSGSDADADADALAEEPVAEEPVAEEPVAEEPVGEEPVGEEPVAEEDAGSVAPGDGRPEAEVPAEDGIGAAPDEPPDPWEVTDAGTVGGPESATADDLVFDPLELDDTNDESYDAFLAGLGAPSGPDGPDLEELEARVAELAGQLLAARRTQETGFKAWLSENGPAGGRGGGHTPSSSDPTLLLLRKQFHELHVAHKRAALDLAIAQARLAEPEQMAAARALVELRQTELEFASHMLLEVTELIALPGNDDEGRTFVLQHISRIFDECNDRRLSAALRLARARAEPHGIRAVQLEIQHTAVYRKLRDERDRSRREGTGVSEDEHRLAKKLAELRVSQLWERHLAAVEMEDEAESEEAKEVLQRVRDEVRALEVAADIRARQKPARGSGTITDQIERSMPTIHAAAARVPHSPEQRLAAAKRMVAEFREFFEEYEAPVDRVSAALGGRLAETWEDYGVAARQLVAAPVVVAGRSDRRTRVQWVKYTTQMLAVANKRLSLLDIEIEVAEKAEDEQRLAFLRVLHGEVAEGIRLMAEVVNSSVGS